MARIDGLKFDYNREPSNHFVQAWHLYPILKERGLMKAVSVLADEGGVTEINGVNILILSKKQAQEEAARRKQPFIHRVYARCDCGRDIPFGKLGQHRKACKVSEEG